MTHDDLHGTPCLVTNCFDHAEAIHQLGIQLPSDVGAPEPGLDLDIHLCGHHAHLLRMGGAGFAYRSME